MEFELTDNLMNLQPSASFSEGRSRSHLTDQDEVPQSESEEEAKDPVEAME